MISLKIRIAAAVQIVSLLSLGTSTVRPNLTATLNVDTPKVRSAEGLVTVSFDLPTATVKVLFPDDMMAGDTISGTVIAESKAGSARDEASGTDTLQGVVVDLGNKQTVSVCDPCTALRSFVIPHVFEQKGGLMKISLVQPGRSAITANVPVQPSAVLTTWDPNIPPFAQSGRPATVYGPFDGNSSNTQCNLGSQPAAILAESPRKAVFKTPTNMTGPVQMSVSDKGKTANGQVRILSVQLTSPKTDLNRGEKTNVHMEIKGLKGESQVVPFRIVTTGTANMQGGNVQDIAIQPSQISATGSFIRDFALTGTSTGVFSVTATVATQNPVAGGQSKCKCECELAPTPILTAGKRSSEGGAENSFSANVAKASCNGNRCSVAKKTYAWSIGAGSTATYTIVGDSESDEKLSLDVTKKGTVELTVTVTVKCSDGTTCSATGTKTFTVDTK